MTFRNILYILLPLWVCLPIAARAQSTDVRGTVVDGHTGEPLPYVNISTNAKAGRQVGTSTDLDGNFHLQTSQWFDTVVATYLGYHTARVAVQPRSRQQVRITLTPQAYTLQEAKVEAARTRYSRKNNPAVTLMEAVIAHKDSNSIARQNYYEYRMHEKTELSLLNVNDSLRHQKAFRKLSFLFDNVQTSTLSGKKYMPIYFTESLTDKHYRRSPRCERSMLLGSKDIKFSKFIDPQSIDGALNDVFGHDIDIYDNYIHILNNELLSPISAAATRFYHFYIDDTLLFQGDTCIALSFTPANMRDIGFSGNLLVSKDSHYAVRQILLEIPKQSGVNFVDVMNIQLEYTPYQGQLCLTKHEELMEGNIYGVQLHGRKAVLLSNYRLNHALPADFYTNNDVTQRTDGYNKRTNAWWETNRIEPLTPSEQQIYNVPQSLNSITTYRVAMNTLMAFVSGYVDVGRFDVGPLENTLSWNDVEGLRLRAGGKSNMQLHPHWFVNGFVAYGTKDQCFKYNAEVMYNFADKLYNQWEFPVNLITAGVEHNTEIPGQTFLMGTYDRLTLSLNRGSTDLMVMNHKYYVEWWYETMSQFSTKLRVEHRTIEPLSQLSGTFHSVATDAQGHYLSTYDREHPLTTATLGLELRYAKNERFYQSQKYRLTTNSTVPIVTFRYTLGASILGAEHSYHKLQLCFDKRWYLWSFGYADLSLQAGTTLGHADYPLLFVHQANQNWAYQDEAFNTMNYFEFVSDHYLQAILNYNFNGWFFHRVPLLRRLGWREAFAVKALWGGISACNTPGPDNDLIDFAVDDQGRYRTYALNDGPYLEANVGIDNIFKVLRVDYVRRFSYLDHPNIAKGGIRLRLHFQF